MSNSLLLIQDPGWTFSPDAVIGAIQALWSMAVVHAVESSDSFTHWIEVDTPHLLIDVGSGFISMQAENWDDCGRVAFAAAQTAPPGTRFVYIDQGNNSAMRTTRETPVEEYFRIWEAPPLSEGAG